MTPFWGQRAGERWHGVPYSSHLTQYPNSLRSQRPGQAALHPGTPTWAATGGACPAGEEGPVCAGRPGPPRRGHSQQWQCLDPWYSSVPGFPGGFDRDAHPLPRGEVEAGSRLQPRAARAAEPRLTLVSHHWVMHSQQKRWPQGVAVVCLRSSRHRVHRELLETALSSTWLLGGRGDEPRRPCCVRGRAAPCRDPAPWVPALRTCGETGRGAASTPAGHAAAAGSRGAAGPPTGPGAAAR